MIIVAESVNAAGDVNKDGYMRSLLEFHMQNPSSRSNAGTSYVIYGGTLPVDVGFTEFKSESRICNIRSSRFWL